MRTLLVAVITLPSVLFAQQTPPHNPCDERPVSQLQMSRCADFESQQADAHLSHVYQRAMQYLADDSAKAQASNDQAQIEYEKNATNSLEQSQQVWLSYRDIQCKAAGQQYQGGSMAPMIFSQCMKTLTNQRIYALKSIYEDGDQKLE
jgi:uncharacterized protein YecT (DUF1311 family)